MCSLSPLRFLRGKGEGGWFWKGKGGGGRPKALSQLRMNFWVYMMKTLLKLESVRRAKKR